MPPARATDNRTNTESARRISAGRFRFYSDCFIQVYAGIGCCGRNILRPYIHCRNYAGNAGLYVGGEIGLSHVALLGECLMQGESGL